MLRCAPMSEPEQPEGTLERIIGERRAKATAMRAGGIDPYRNDVFPKTSLAEVRARYEATKPAPQVKAAPNAGTDAGAPKEKQGIVPIDGLTLRVSGRAMTKRGMGKTVFVP